MSVTWEGTLARAGRPLQPGEGAMQAEGTAIVLTGLTPGPGERDTGTSLAGFFLGVLLEKERKRNVHRIIFTSGFKTDRGNLPHQANQKQKHRQSQAALNSFCSRATDG